MNKIFKVIFNRTTQKMEVVSELAKSQGKAASSIDERGEIKLAAGILSGATFIGGMAAFLLSAVSAEAAVIIDSITSINGATTGNYGSLTITTNTSIPNTSSTLPYNYFNPGSLSYTDKDSAITDNRTLYNTSLTSAVVIGHNATAKEDRGTSNKASGVAIGDYSHAGGALSIAIGPFSRTADTGSIALGTSSRSEGFNSFAAMRQSAAIADYSAAIGSSSWANEKASFAIGASATALGNRSFAIGSGTPQTVEGSQGWENKRSIYDGQNNTLAVGSDAFSIGTKAKTNGESAFAIGTNAQAGGFVENSSGNVTLPNGTNITIAELGTVVNADSTKKANNAYALGTNTRAHSNDTVAFSTNANATGDGSIAFGVNSNTTGTGAIAFGNASKAWKNNAISIGWNATSHAEKVISIGSHSNASKDGAMAIGDTASSSGNNSVAIGYSSNVSNANATAVGTRANITHEGGTAIGFEAESKGNYATAIAYNSTASGENSIAAGVNSNVSGARAAALGYNNTVSGNDTFVLGSNVTVNTVGSVVLGSDSAQAEAKSENTATVGNLTYGGFAGKDNVTTGDYVSIGNATNARQIKFVAPGNISSTSTDAINGSQLYATNDMINNVTTSIKDNFGGNATVNPNGTITYTNIGDTGKDNINDAIKAAKTKVEAGTNVNVTSKTGSNGETVYTVNANHTTVSSDNTNYVNVTSSSTGNNVTNFAVDLAQETKNKIDNALANFTVGADKNASTAGVEVNKTNTRFDIVGGDNVTTNVAGRTITVDLSQATKDAIKTNADNIAKGFGLEAQDGQNVTKQLGEKVKVVGGNNNINTTIAGGEVKINLNNTLDLGDTGLVKIGDTTVNNNGLTINGGPNITKTGIDAGNKKVTNVTAGDISSTSTDAVNGSQLYQTNTNVTNLNATVAKGFNITADNSALANSATEDNVQLGQTVTYSSTDKNIITTVSDNKIDFGLNSTLSVGKAGENGKDGSIGVNGKDGSAVVLNGKDGSIGLTGPKGADGTSVTSNITVKSGAPNVSTANGENGKDGANITRIVYDTPNGLEEVATLNDGLRFTGNNADTINKHKLNSLVTVKGEGVSKENSTTFASAAGNVNVKADGSSTLEVQLAKNLNLTKDGSVVIGNTTVNNDGLTIAGGPNVTKTGIDAGSKKITNVADGEVSNTSKDAVNGSQLYTVQEIANSGWNIAANGNNQTNVKPKANVSLNNVDGNIIISKTDADNNVTFALNNELSIGGKDGANGKDGKIGVKGADGKDGVTVYGNGTVIAGRDGAAVVLNGKDGSIGLTGPKGEDGTPGPSTNISVVNGQPGVDGKDGDTKPRIVYTNATGGNEEIATLNDGLKFVGDDNKVIAKKLNETLNVTGGITELNKLSDNNIGVVNTNNGLVIKLAKDLNLTKDGSVIIGNSTLNDSGLTIANGPSITNTGINAGNKQITNVSSGLTDANGNKTDLANATTTNAVNVGDLKDTVNTLTNATTGGFGLTGDDKNTEVKQDLGKTIQVKGKDGVTVTANVAEKALEIALAGDVSVSGKDGKDGSIGVKGKDGENGVTINGNGTIVVGKDGQPGSIGINGKDGTIGINGKDGSNATMTVEKGAPGLDGAKGKDGKTGEKTTRIVYTNEKGEKEEVANLNDGLRFTGNNEVENKHKLNSLVTIIGEGVTKEQSINFASAAGNINVKADGQGNLTVQLAKNLNLTDAGSVTIGGTNVTNEGITINNGPKITSEGGNIKIGDVNGAPVKITNVKEGDLSETSKDAVNGSQLYATNQNVTNVTNKVNGGFNIDADNRVAGLDKADNVQLGDTIKFTDPDSNIITTVSDNQIQFGLNSTLSVGGKDGKPGEIGVKGADGKDGITIKPDAIVFNGVDGKDGAPGRDGQTSLKIQDGAKGLDGNDGKDGESKTRIVYEKPDGKTEEVATLNDGLKFGANDGKVHDAKLNTQVDIKGATTNTEWAKFDAGQNIMTQVVGNTITVALAKDLAGLNSATFGTDSDSTVINKDGITITKKDPNDATKSNVTLTENGLDNGNNQIVNVKSGIDGVNGKDGQPVKSVNDLTSEDLTKVGTNAANINDVVNASKDLIAKGFKITADNKDLEDGAKEDTVELGQTVNYTSKDKNIITTVRDNEIDFGLSSTLSVGKDGEPGKPGEAGTIGVKGQDGKDGVSIKGDTGANGEPGEATVVVGRNGKDGDNGIDGKVGVNGKDGSAVVLNGKDGSIGLNGKDGKDGLTFKSADGAQGVDGKDGENGLPGANGTTRIVYQPTDKDGNPIKDDKGNPITEKVATLNDGLIFAGNNDKLNRHKLNSVVNIIGEVAKGINDKESSENFKSAAGNINVVANEKDQLEIQLNRDLKDLATANFVEYKEDGSVNADAPKTVVNNNGVTITPKDGKDGKDGNVVSLTKDGLNNGGNQIVNVKSGIDGLNGQNGKDGQTITSVNDLTEDQLKDVGNNAANIKDVRNATDSLINKGFNITADNSELENGEKVDNVKLGETVNYTSKDKNIITTVSNNAIDFALNNNLTIGGPGKDGKDGVDGTVGVKGADGTAGVSLNGKDGSIGLTGPKGADGKDGASATISVKDGAKGLDGNDGKDGESKTRIVYEKPNGDKEEVATLNDGLRFVGDDGKVIDKKLNETLQISGGDTDLDDLSDDNIGVVNKDGKLMVKLARNIDLTEDGSITIGDTYIDTNVVGVGDSALTGDSLTVGGDNSITVDGNKGTIGGLTNKTFDPNNFTSGQAATEDQLKQVYDVANSGWDIAANGQNTTNVGPKGKVSFNNEDGNIIITKETTDNNVTFALNNDLTIGGPGKDGKPGKDGAIGVKGADGKTGVSLNGKDGTIGINGKDGSNGTMTFEQGKPGVDGKDGETKTRIVYETKDKDGNPVKEEVATLNDGLKFVGDDGKVITKKLNETLSITGGEKDATKLSDANNIGVVNNNGTLTVKLAKDIDLTKDGSVTIGNTTVNNDGLTIKDGPSVTKGGINAGNEKVTNVKDGEISSTSKDAVNGSQLYQVQQVANAGWNLTANGKDKGNVKPGATVDLNNKDGNIVITKEGNNVTFGLNNDLTIGGKDGKDGQIGVAGKDGKDGVTIKGDGTIVAGRDGQDGVDGSIGATGKDGASVVLNGKDGSIGLTGPKGADGKSGASANIKVQDGAEGVDGTNGKDGLPGENGKTRIVYETIDKDGKPVTEQVATLNDGLIFSGNNEEIKNRQKLNTEVKVKGEGVDKAASENFKSASGNINVKANGTDTLEVQLAKAIDLTEDGSVTTGGTTVNNNGLTIKDGPSVTKGGIDAKDTKITNVKDGDVTATSKDAVNGSQLYNAIENAGWDLTVDGNVAADSEEGSKRVNNNGKVAVKGGKNIVVSRKGSAVEVSTSSNPEFDTVKVGGTTISSTVAKDGVNELNVAGSNNAPTRITNVAEGVKGTDAVNVNQLKGAENRLNNRINNVDKDLRAGIAGALAAGNLYHVTQPGKSMVSAGVGTYRGQGAVAVGYSRLSDNGKVGIKFSLNSDTRGQTGAAASVGYQW
ncbi:YadA-like family protein [Mannheimia indoligenes]|uniref:YadA-like family protein n=1 Tax=Mannheimia indoligenes TaxID=3103145 RepID=UPI002FE68598